MDDGKRSVGEELDFQLATRYFASAFEHCQRLSAADQQLLLNDIAKQVSEHLSAIASPEQQGVRTSSD
jgi:hypothetical protein